MKTGSSDHSISAVIAELNRHKTFLHLPKWASLYFTERIKQVKGKGTSSICNDEMIWTMLLLLGYCSPELEGLGKLCGLLTGNKVSISAMHEVWAEGLPLSPREREDQTSIDLALGNIQRRGKSEHGFELGHNYDSNWICFCEMKCLSDIAVKVSHNPIRNQLARIIESALCLQNQDGRLADHVYVTLVTPEVFRTKEGRGNRFYSYKFYEYSGASDRVDNLLSDLPTANRRAESRYGVYKNWKYPANMRDRISRVLHLNWITHEELICNLPESNIKEFILKFAEASKLLVQSSNDRK